MPAASANIGRNTTILYPNLVGPYGCAIAAAARIAPFVEIRKSASVGARCAISLRPDVCESVTIEDEVFIARAAAATARSPRPIRRAGDAD